MRQERGFVLISVMLALTLLTLVVTEFVFSMRLEASMARSYRDQVLAEHLADAAVQQAVREILGQAQIVAPDETGQLVFYRVLPGQTTPRRLPTMSRTHVPLGRGEFSYRITDEAARLDINSTPPIRMDRLLEALGLPRSERDIINDSIQDWRDRDELRRVNGAESEDTYLKLPVPYRSRNGNLQDVAELRQIRGITPELYAGTPERPGLRDLLTAIPLGGVNLNTAAAPALTAFGLADAEVSEALGARRRTPYLVLPARFAGRGLGVETATFRIEAEGVIPGSATSRLVAVIQRGGPGGSAGVTVRQWRPVIEP